MSLERRDVSLQVLQGPIPGRVFTVSPGATLTIGRLPDCGIAHPDDPTLSRLHAVLENHADGCWLVNRSSNGTFVNEESIERIRLVEGDIIQCAQLALKFLGTGEPDSSSTSVWERPTRPNALETINLEFVEAPLPVGWSSLTPKSPDMEVEYALTRLEQLPLSAYALVDWRRAQMEAPPETPPGLPLFHWLPPESAALASPVVIPWAKADWSREILDRAVGKDALLWVFSEHPFEDAVTLLRQATGYGTSPGLVGYCWPSVFSQLVQHQSGDLIQNVLAAGPAWVIDQKSSFQLVIRPDLRDQLIHRSWRLESHGGAAGHPD